MAEAWKGRIAGTAETGGRIAELVFHLLFPLSNFTYEMEKKQGKLPRRAILGSQDMDVLASGPSGSIFHIHFISEI